VKNPSGAPNMVWGMYILISLNRIYKIRLAPTKLSALPGWISIQTATRLVIDALRQKFGPMDYHDPRVQTVIQMAKSMELVKDNPARVRKNIFVFNNSPSGPADEDAARELELYIDNDRDFYFQQFIPIVKNLMLKRRKGVYNRELAVKLFMYLMDAGAKKYVREFGTAGQKIDAMFNKNTRLLAARAFRDSFENEAELGNYDRLIGPVSNPRGYRKMGSYEVIVGNIGIVYSGNSKASAEANFNHYVRQSKSGSGRASGESVTLMCEGEILREHIGTAENPRGVRKNIFLFNNGPRKLNSMEQAAAAVGLVIGTWAPGDGQTRYRFFLKSGKSSYGDYHQGDGLYTALGRKDAMAFIAAYGKGRSARRNPSSVVRTFRVPVGLEQQIASMLRGAFIFAKATGSGEVLTMARPEIVKRAVEYVQEHGWPTKRNPLTRAEAGYLLRHARRDIEEARSARSRDLTWEQKYHTGRARGIGFAVQETGPKAAKRAWVTMHTTLDRVLQNPPACSNPVIRGDKLPPHLKAEVLRKFIYRWTTGNTQLDQAYRGIETPRIPMISDEQWLREHAFHVTKDGRLSLRHHHAEPYYMADDWKKGDPRPNPLLQTVLLANPGSVKTFNEMQDVGKAKYVVNYHDGVKVHRDGSPFFDIAIFSSRAKKDRFVRKLESLGFTRGAIRNTPMTLKRWAAKQPFRIAKHGQAFVIPDGRLVDRAAAWHLSDYAVSSVAGGSIWFTKRSATKNPPISATWDVLTRRQREAVLEVVGYDRDYSGGMVRSSWSTLSPSAKRKLEAGWLDTSYRSTGETTRRRYAPVGANPLTRREAGQVLRDARFDVRHGSIFQAGHTRSSRAGMAFGKAKVVRQYGPRAARRAANRISDEARKVARTTMSNPGSLRLPKPGTRLTVTQALELARRIGDRALIAQCQKALKLQKAANRSAKCVIWKTFPMGSSDKIDQVVALTHYGDTPETMYKPPKGSKKGQHMYRHKWGEGGGGKKTVPLLASADGKMLLMPLEGRKVASDWLRH
jgi:hypothetical protein